MAIFEWKSIGIELAIIWLFHKFTLTSDKKKKLIRFSAVFDCIS